MEEFVQIYENNRKEAVDIFFLPNFEEVFLQGKPEQKELYHSLMKSRSKSLILEEFLTAAGYKNTSFLDVSQDKLVLEEEDSSAQLELLLTLPFKRFCFLSTLKSSFPSVKSSLEKRSLEI